MIPGTGLSMGDMRSSLRSLGEPGLDAKIALLAAITLFINAYLCAAVALLATVYAFISAEKRKALLHAPHARWMFLFCILLFIVPPVYSNWLGLAAGLAVFVILVFYLYLGTFMTEGLFNTVIDLACLISLIYVVIALFQRLFGLAPRSPSTFENANYYSSAMELVLVAAFYRLTTARQWKHRAFVLLVIAADMLAIWTADSRAAWPSVFVGLAVYFGMNRMTKSFIGLIVAYIVGIKLTMLFPAMAPRLGSLGISDMSRADIWQQALAGIQTHLLFGAGTLGYRHLVGGPYPHSHNLLLEILISFGLVGAGLLAAYFMLTLIDIAKRFKASPHRKIYALVFAALAVTLVHGVADVTILWPQTGMLLVLLLSGGAIRECSTKLEAAKAFPDLGA